MMMDHAEHLISAVLQILFQRCRLERIDAEDDVRLAVFISIHTDVRDVAVIADEHFGDLSDGAQLILHADDDAAALFTVAEDLQKGLNTVVPGSGSR